MHKHQDIIIKPGQIRKGDMVYCHQPLVQMDEAVFGPDAADFKPKRFVGNPGLKEKVCFRVCVRA